MQKQRYGMVIPLDHQSNVQKVYFNKSFKHFACHTRAAAEGKGTLSDICTYKTRSASVLEFNDMVSFSSIRSHRNQMQNS